MACPENLHCIESIFVIIQNVWETLHLPWKSRVFLEMFHSIEYIFYYSGFLTKLCLPWKTKFDKKFFTVLSILFPYRICEQLDLAWKQSVLWKFSPCYHSGFLSNFALTLKNRAWPGFTAFNKYFLSIRIFEQLLLDLKNRFGLKISTALKYFLSFRIFEELYACHERQSWPWNFSLYWMYFFH